MSATRAIAAIFFLQAFAFGSVFPRLPDIQAGLELSDASLGFGLTIGAIGGMLSLLISSHLVAKFGTRLILMTGLPTMAVFAVGIAVAPNTGLLFVFFLFNGVAFSLTNIAMNIEADRIESQSGQKVMNRSHALWSAGMLISALGGVGARALPISVFSHFSILAPLLVGLALIVIWPMVPAPRSADDKSDRSGIALPSRRTIVLMLFALSAGIGQSATQNWSVIFMDQAFGAPDWIDTMVLPAYLACLMVSRLLSDSWMERFGKLPVIYTQSCLALVGLLMVVGAPFLWMALLGFGLIGFGTAILFPMTISAAARDSNRPAADSVAAIILATAVVMTVAPAFMGWVSDQIGLRAAFATALPSFILTILMVRRVLGGPN